jgi:hypothetical protein
MRKISIMSLAVTLVATALLAASGATAARKGPDTPRSAHSACVQALVQARQAFDQQQRADREAFKATHPSEAAREAFGAAQDAARQAFQAQQEAGREACKQAQKAAIAQRRACLKALNLTKKQFHQQQQAARKAFEATHPTEAAQQAFDTQQQQARKAFDATYKTQKKACQALGH